MAKKNNLKVIIAMSGGIDSSVAAALLKRAGFDVVGIFMRFWSEGGSGRNRCCSPEAEKRARLVAQFLGIPFYVFNFEKEFKKRIVDYFLKEYKAGRTPNPCVVCNKEIKFGLLLEKALALGADFVATGHYVRRDFGRQGPIKLLMARDKEKDQSYFLWQLSQNQLRRILFPVGNYTKSQVRQLAEKYSLPLVSAPESMEVCFIKDSIPNFLARNLKQKSGRIVGDRGEVLGRHHGLAFYTIGQRRGIELTGGPFFVLKKDTKKNLLIVTKNEKRLFEKEMMVKNFNWISGRVPRFPLRVQVKIRYRHPAVPAVIEKKFRDGRLKVIFDVRQKAITPGQSAVFYNGQELLGGGIILDKSN
jgi:tRNA-specific 2-thiouridylase